MRILSLNVNGIRSAQRKGVWEWLGKIHWDVLCIQEVRADEVAAQSPLAGVKSYVYSAARPGYSGTAIYSRVEPHSVTPGIQVDEFDTEGRILMAQWASLRVVSAYFPSGSSSEDRQKAKFRFLEAVEPQLDAWRKDSLPTVICGDFNIAHKELDLKNWKGNQKNSGFLPEERAWVSERLAEGWEDTHRKLYPEVPGYTWWSNRGQAYAKDVGWRIDYQWANPGASGSAHTVSVYKDERFSDHAPLIVDYEGIKLK
ncbi:MAG: exodeoxyribonuclease III [Pseudomonadota bacterium]